MQKLFALVLAITMLFSVAIVVHATPAPVPGYPLWDEKYTEAKIVPPASGPDSELPDNPRNNASGDKIPSNAHSADYPGLYFYWNDKQKDNGVLLVAPEVFKLFEGCKFVLTAKNSDHYWGYEIKQDAGQLIDGVYAYGINKQVKYMLIGNKGEITAKTDDLKNINMVFIDGNYKKGCINIKKTWLNWEGNVLAEKPDDVADASFGSAYPTTGIYPISINTWNEAINGVKVTVTEDPIPGFDTSVNDMPGNSVTLTVKPNIMATASFANREQPATVIVKKRWLIGDDEVEGGVVTFTNGYKPGENTVEPNTKVSFTESGTAGWELTDVQVEGVDGVDVADLTKDIVFVAERGKTYNIQFTNWKPAPMTGTLYIDKKVNGEIITDWQIPDGVPIESLIEGFSLYPVIDGKIKSENAEGYVNISDVIAANGTVVFKKLKAGSFAVVEQLTDAGRAYFEEPEPLFVEFNGVTVDNGEATYYYSDGSIDGGAVVEYTAYVTGNGIYTLPETWNDAIYGMADKDPEKYAEYPAMMQILAEMGAKWIWDEEDTYVHGESGSVVEFEFEVEVDADMTVPFYFAADNAAIVYVNGELAGYTQVALRNNTNISEVYREGVFDGLSEAYFDGGWEGGWTHVYAINIDLKAVGPNKIIVVAANSKWTEEGQNRFYNITNNPCGVIFGMAVGGNRMEFNNVTKPMANVYHQVNYFATREGVADFSDEDISAGSDYTIRDADEIGISRDGYAFAGWSAEPEGSVDEDYSPGRVITLEGDLDLYAVWVTQSMVTYNAGLNGTGGSVDSNLAVGSAYVIKSAVSAGVDKRWCNFDFWTVELDPIGYYDGISYFPSQEITLTGDLVLYATWYTEG